MKKALQISIAKTLFTIEEDAYEKLDKYLKSVKEHFKNTEGSEEIITDIETRIAEQLLDTKEKVITLSVVEKVLTIMGAVDDFDDEPSHTETKVSGNRKFYRNPDDMLIAGVCSGLAVYLNIDVVWVRLAFIIFTLLNGFGILLYVVLWILVPEAKTKSQKLEMSGSPVTLETLSETVSEKVEEVKKNGPKWREAIRKIIALPFKIIGAFLRGLARILVPLVRVLLGIVLIIVSLAVLVAVMISSGFLTSNELWISNDIPIQALLPGNLEWFVLFGAVLALAIPAFFILIAGVSLLRKKSTMPASIGIGLIVVWLGALMISGVSTAKVATNYQRFVDNSPAHQKISKELTINDDFKNIKLENGLSLSVIQGTTTSLTASGVQRSIDSLEVEIVDGTLVISNKPFKGNNLCIFCFIERPELTLITKDIDSAEVQNGSSFELEGINTEYFKTDQFDLKLKHGSHANLSLMTENFVSDISNGSSVDIVGSASTSQILVEHGSTFSGMQFKVGDATTTATNGSHLELFVSNNLNASAKHGSQIYFGGSLILNEQESNGSTIKPFEAWD